MLPPEAARARLPPPPRPDLTGKQFRRAAAAVTHRPVRIPAIGPSWWRPAREDGAAEEAAETQVGARRPPSPPGAAAARASSLCSAPCGRRSSGGGAPASPPALCPSHAASLPSNPLSAVETFFFLNRVFILQGPAAHCGLVSAAIQERHPELEIREGLHPLPGPGLCASLGPSALPSCWVFSATLES